MSISRTLVTVAYHVQTRELLSIHDTAPTDVTPTHIDAQRQQLVCQLCESGTTSYGRDTHLTSRCCDVLETALERMPSSATTLQKHKPALPHTARALHNRKDNRLLQLISGIRLLLLCIWAIRLLRRCCEYPRLEPKLLENIICLLQDICLHASQML